MGHAVSDALTGLMAARSSHVAGLAEGGTILPVVRDAENAYTAQLIVPIVAGGDCLGAVILLSEESGAVMEASCVKLARLTADIIASQFD